ncbi:hypothetical protein [Halomonas icarae]|uniref:Uncharacterized protein n=1 Tax=Halomonas icarae TaxID=2691040 RepID=A0A7X4VXK0_9GAMM|nr:hypothetical protein [Halomonas icarae]MDR5901033.1 hypothetical protein [Halomonas icarae]NAW11308.1 hypothetical protein [Halomonas icarae]
MAKRVITLSVQSERITFTADDWPAIKRAVGQALDRDGGRKETGRDSLIQAQGFDVAERSKLTGERVYEAS